MWGSQPPTAADEFAHLPAQIDTERAAFELVRGGLRLEQERIPWLYAVEPLRAL